MTWWNPFSKPDDEPEVIVLSEKPKPGQIVSCDNPENVVLVQPSYMPIKTNNLTSHKVKRRGWIEGRVGYIPLTKGQIAKVDPEDLYWLTKWNWCARWDKDTGGYYAYKSSPNGIVSMHRFILGIDDPEIKVDHKYHDTLDNRKSELRVCSNEENCTNKLRKAPNSSGYTGVTWNKVRNRYQIRIRSKGKSMCLGYCDDPVEGYVIYLRKARELHGEFLHPKLEQDAVHYLDTPKMTRRKK